MKILFSNPPWWEVDSVGVRKGIRAGSRWPFTMVAPHDQDAFRFGGYLPFPFFLGYSASYTARELPHAYVSMRDSVARGEGYTKYLRAVEALSPDFIVIETATPSWPHDSRLIKKIAANVPHAKVILAGTLDCASHAEVFAKNTNVHAIVRGEYDKQIVRAIAGDPRKVYEHALLTVDEMNAAPLPMFDEDCAHHYWDACPTGHEPYQLQVWTSRGCPYKCVFCVWPSVMTGNDPDGTKPRAVRCYSPEYMEAFLRDRLVIAERAGKPFRSIYLDDDTANLVNKHTVAMCGVMKRIGLPWSAMCRADTSTREVWQLMKDSGCFGVKIGFESGSQEVIDKIVNKRLNLAEAADTARWLRSIGMSVHGTFTVGLPGETHVQQQETIKFIENLYATGGLDTHQLSGTATIEGTPLAHIAAGEHLAKYPGASAEGFQITGDGQRKAENIIK